jgi:hypothetical protein
MFVLPGGHSLAASQTAEGSHTPEEDVPVPVLNPSLDHADPPDSPRAARERCPLCHGSEYIKSFTPWGCPTSYPCPRCSQR